MTKVKTLITALILSFATSFVSAQSVIDIGHGLGPKSAFGLGMERFGEVLAERSGGKLTIQQHFKASLGSEREMIESVQLGALDMVLAGTGTLANFVPEARLFDLPFLFRSYEHAYTTLDGPIGRELLAKVDEAGFKALAWSETGFRNITNSKRPIHTPADLKGLKIRTQENAVHIAMFKAMGAAPTPMSWPEVIPALQQKVIDAQENPTWVVKVTKLFEVQKHLTLTGHVYAPAIILMSKSLWAGYSSEEQAWFEEAAREAVKVTRDIGRGSEESALEFLREKGMEIVTNPDKSKFQEATKPVYKTYIAEFGSGFIDRIAKTE
jgi:tripartite ATP-independent transporter DctP family solute receptor